MARGRTIANVRFPPISAVRHSRREGQLRGLAPAELAPTRGGPSPECPRPAPPAPPRGPPADCRRMHLVDERGRDTRTLAEIASGTERFVDSPLEEDGFEPSVPLAELLRGTKGSNPSLSRRTICLTIEFPGYGGKPPDIRMALAVALRVQRCGRSEDRSLLCWRGRRAGRGPACRKTRIAGLMYFPQVCHEAPGMALNLTVLAGSGTR